MSEDKKKRKLAFSKEAREKLIEQMKDETGIDFTQYQTEALGERISNIMDVFSWLGLALRVIFFLIPFMVLFYFFVIAKPHWPVDSKGDLFFLIGGVVWCFFSLITVGISSILWFAMRRLSGTTSELLSLLLNLLEKTAASVKECTMGTLIRLVTANSTIVIFPLVVSVISTRLSIGKLKLPGAKFIAEKIGEAVTGKISSVVIEKLEVKTVKGESEDITINPKDDETILVEVPEAVEKKSVKSVVVDSLSVVQKVSSSLNTLNKKVSSMVVKPFAVSAFVISVIAFLPPVLLAL